MFTTNLHRLSSAQRAIQAKKREKRNQINQVIFDDDARRMFLTGFHKRKVARTEAARAKAKEKEKREKLEARRERRQILRDRALENATQIEKACGATSDDGGDEWQGIGTSNSQATECDEEYENDETLTTVTVVEDFDPHALIRGPLPPKTSTELYTEHGTSMASSSHTRQTAKHRKIRYETKHERKKEREKQRARRLEKAELAGGKVYRKSLSGTRRRRKG